MLDKRSRNILIAFGVILLIITITEVTRPKPLNWKSSFTAVDKIPFGSYVLFEELPSLFKDATIEKIKGDPYEFLKEDSYENNSAYILINDNISIDKQQLESFKNYVEAGNTILLSARNFGQVISDSLLTETIQDYSILENDLKPRLFNKSFHQDSIPIFKKGVYKSVFTTIDTIHTKALGYFDLGQHNTETLNYISISFGKGTFLFHTLPEAFSNYYLINGYDQYAAQVLSYIDADTIYWDTYLKSGRKIIDSPMRFVFNQKSLQWAYYTLMLGLILFIIIKGKREQRVIEVIEPLQNTSIEFTKTIGDLYFQHKDFANIVAKKITYFLEVVRSKYYLDTTELNSEFIQKLALKSNVSLEKTTKLIQLITHLKGKAVHSEQDIIALNKQIEDFKIWKKH
ncbi:MAG: hypothetical protein ACI884_000228 [Ulvibacter sp.]|jgi:hypothetical protein